ncbi:ASST-domain-containing protein [Daldinia sp. FL1419]|nr:ASST-domain-containing protein [Daldinia sp. FL1419]
MSLSFFVSFWIWSLHAVLVSAENYTWPWQTYKSSSAEPPLLKISKSGPTSPGYLFFNQNGEYAHNYSLFIMSDDGELVWQSGYGDYSAFRTQTFEGKPVLTFFNGVSLGEPYGWGHGIVQILDDSYTSIYNVSLTLDEGNFLTIPELDPNQLASYLDIHESQITAQDTILVTLYNVTKYDLSSWSALEHDDQIPISNVQQFYPVADFGRNQTIPYGYFHINSVDKFEDGSYLISSRYYCSIFKISKNGTVEWTLQGQTGGDFELDGKLSFCYQHDARIRREFGSVVQISLFDNANSEIVSGVNQTKGVFLTLDTKTMKAKLDHAYVDPQDAVYAFSQGNVQLLEDGHVIMGYGSTPKIREFSPDGTTLMTAQFGPGDGLIFSYRAYRLPWVGRPKTPPSVVACNNEASNSTKVYISWSGATEHKFWKVFTGHDNSSFTLQSEVERTGFETVATIPGQVPFVRVEAQGVGVAGGVSHVVSPQNTC